MEQIKETNSASHLLMRSLLAQGVTHIFGIPGGKIMGAFDSLNDFTGQFKVVVCRHEQNAAFMAGAIGRLTGRPGVCLVTSGPGTSNLATGLLTATTEGDPVVAIGGAVPLKDTLRQVHQTMEAVDLMKPATKYSVAVPTADAVGEVVANAFRAAISPRAGASFIAFPQDIQLAPTDAKPLPRIEKPLFGPAAADLIRKAADALRGAQNPVVLLGMGASESHVTAAVGNLLRSTGLPVTGTFQGAGAVSRDLLAQFFGRVGLFRNQPGDQLLGQADLVLTIGYDPVEYGPESWNPTNNAKIIHLDDTPCSLSNNYAPEIELLGDVAETVHALSGELAHFKCVVTPRLEDLHSAWAQMQQPPTVRSKTLVHPLDFVLNLRRLIDDDTIIASDMGSHHIWMARHFVECKPRKLLFSDGQQTLGVGIPWAMAASFLYPGQKVIATVGDAGFLYASMELETAVREDLNITVFVFRDGSYNMVAFQQKLEFNRTSGVEFGNPDIVKYAESLGCKAYRVERPDMLGDVMQTAITTPGVVIVDMPVDYSHNLEIGQHVLPNAWN